MNDHDQKLVYLLSGISLKPRKKKKPPEEHWLWRTKQNHKRKTASGVTFR